MSVAETVMKLGYRLILDLEVPEQNAAFHCGEYESATLQECLARLPPDGVALDIGANIGVYACAFGMRLRGGGGKTFAFEPVRANAARLRENVELNRLAEWVEVVPLALGRDPGKVVMHIEPEGGTNNAVGDNMLAEHDRRAIGERAWKSEEVPCARLDDWASEAQVQRCDLIKIDVEGAELQVLAGGAGFIRRHRPAIMGEFNPYWMAQAGEHFKDVIDFFRPYSYRFFREIGGEFVPLSEDKIAPPPEIPSYLLLPSGMPPPKSGRPG